jgi:mono/diheme cytochrome c family protein
VSPVQQSTTTEKAFFVPAPVDSRAGNKPASRVFNPVDGFAHLKPVGRTVTMKEHRYVLAISLSILGLTAWEVVRADGPAAWVPKGLPADLWQLLVPPENPVTPEKVSLGRSLYFDKRLSKDGSVSCATCHDPAQGFAEADKVAEGIGGKKGARNSPTVLNAVFNEFQFWDGRATSLEEQAKGPLVNPVEMGFANHDEVVAAVRGVPEYVTEFQKLYGHAPTIDDVVGAIATF